MLDAASVQDAASGGAGVPVALPNSPTPHNRPLVVPRFTTVEGMPLLTITARSVQSTYQASGDARRGDRDAAEGAGQAAAPQALPTIVLQFDSSTINLGLATDALAHSTPHVVAWRPREDAPGSTPRCRRQCDAMQADNEPAAVDLRSVLADRLEARRERSLAMGVSAVAGHPRRRAALPLTVADAYGPIIAYNERSAGEPQTLTALNDGYSFDWTVTGGAPSICGRAALYVNPEEGYMMRWPIRRNRFNALDYASMAAVADDLETIWVSVIGEKLGIARGAYGRHQLLLVIPDALGAAEVKALVELAVERMRFAAVAILQESVATTFGAGLSAACVVNVASQTSSVACIEDGQLVGDSLTIIPYGGDDLTRLLFEALSIHAFPYRECALDNVLDSLMLKDVRRQLCTLDEEHLAPIIHEAYVRAPGAATRIYSFKVFEEALIVAMALFEEGLPLLRARPIGGGAAERAPKFALPPKEALSIYYCSTDGGEAAGGATAAPAGEAVPTEGAAEGSLVQASPGGDARSRRIAVGADGEAVPFACPWLGCPFQWRTVDEAFDHFEGEHWGAARCECIIPAAVSSEASKRPAGEGRCGYAFAAGDKLLRKCHYANHIACHGKRAAAPSEAADGADGASSAEAGLPSIGQMLLRALHAVSEEGANAERVKKFLSSIMVVGEAAAIDGFTRHLEAVLYRAYPSIVPEFIVAGSRIYDGSSAAAKAGGRDAGNEGTLSSLAWKGGCVFAKLECTTTEQLWMQRRDLQSLGARILRERLSFVPLT